MVVAQRAIGSGFLLCCDQDPPVLITALHVVAPLGADPDHWVRDLRIAGWSGGAPVLLKVASHIVHDAGEDWVAFELDDPKSMRCFAAAELQDDSVTWSSFGWPEPKKRPDGIGLKGTVESLETHIRRETETTRTRHEHIQLHSPPLAANRSAKGYSGGPVLVNGCVVGMIARQDPRIDWAEVNRLHKQGPARTRHRPRRDTSSGGALYALPIMTIVTRIQNMSDRLVSKRSPIAATSAEQMSFASSSRHREVEFAPRDRGAREGQDDNRLGPHSETAVAALSELLAQQCSTCERLCRSWPAWRVAAQDGANPLAKAIVATDANVQLRAFLTAMRDIKPGATAKDEAKSLLDVLVLALPCMAWARPALQLDAHGTWITSVCHPETLEPHMAFRDTPVGEVARADYLEPRSQTEGPVPRHFVNAEYVPEPGMDTKDHARQVKDDLTRRSVQKIGEWWFDLRGRKLWYERRPPEHRAVALRASFDAQPRSVYTLLQDPDPRIVAALDDALPNLQVVHMRSDVNRLEEDYLAQELIGEIYRQFCNIK